MGLVLLTAVMISILKMVNVFLIVCNMDSIIQMDIVFAMMTMKESMELVFLNAVFSKQESMESVNVFQVIIKAIVQYVNWLTAQQERHLIKHEVIVSQFAKPHKFILMAVVFVNMDITV